MKLSRYLLGCGLVFAFGALYSCAHHLREGSGTLRPGEEPAKVVPSNFQPMTISQCTRLGDVSFRIDRGTDSCIARLTAYENDSCSDSGERVEPIKELDQKRLFIGPLSGNNVCPETVTVRTGSPCFMVEFDSGGRHYKYCYHGSSRIDCALMGPPTSGICRTHP
jgi:hypothetical protein